MFIGSGLADYDVIKSTIDDIIRSIESGRHVGMLPNNLNTLKTWRQEGMPI